MNRFGAAILAIASLLAGVSCAPEPSSKSSQTASPAPTESTTSAAPGTTIHIGSLDIPDSRRSSKVVLLRGKVLSRRVEVTFRDSVSYLNGEVWMPSPPPPPDPPLPDSALKAVIEMTSATPFVRRRLAEGATAEQAVRELFAAEGAMFDRVSRLYRGFRDHDSRVAIERARAAIDPELAVADPKSPDAPQFDRGGFSIVVFGRGRVSVMQTGGGGPRLPYGLGEADFEFRQLRAYLDGSTPVLVSYGSGGTSIYHGGAAVRALATLDSSLESKDPPEVAVERINVTRFGRRDALDVIRENR
jgi:hypothetical protein